MKLLNRVSVRSIQDHQLAFTAGWNFNRGNLTPVGWDIRCKIFCPVSNCFFLTVFYIENFYHTEIFPPPPCIRLKCSIHNFSISVTKLFIDGNVFCMQPMLSVAIFYIKCSPVPVAGFQVQQWIISQLVREKIISHKFFVDGRDILDPIVHALAKLLSWLNRDHFITCSSGQLFIVIESIFPECFVTNSWISFYSPLEWIEQSPECARVPGNLAPKIQAIFFPSVIHDQVPQGIVIGNKIL